MMRINNYFIQAKDLDHHYESIIINGKPPKPKRRSRSRSTSADNQRSDAATGSGCSASVSSNTYPNNQLGVAPTDDIEVIEAQSTNMCIDESAAVIVSTGRPVKPRRLSRSPHKHDERGGEVNVNVHQQSNGSVVEDSAGSSEKFPADQDHDEDVIDVSVSSDADVRPVKAKRLLSLPSVSSAETTRAISQSDNVTVCLSDDLTTGADSGQKHDIRSKTEIERATGADVSTDSAISAHSRNPPDDELDDEQSVFDDVEVLDHTTRNMSRDLGIGDRCENTEQNLDETQAAERDQVPWDTTGANEEIQSHSIIQRLQRHIKELETQKMILHNEVSG